LSTRNYVHNGILTSYANALINNGKLEEGIKLSKTQIERASNPNVGDYQNIARAYELMGQDLDAFTTLESYLTAGNFNTAVLNSLEPLYTKLNGGKGSFDEYRKGLEARIKKSLKAKYKETMI